MLKKMLAARIKDERGVETLEYIAVGALIVAMAVLVYPGTLGAAIQAVIADISTKLTGIIN